MTFAIGSKNADQAELDEIAFEPSLVFNVGSKLLFTIQKQVLGMITTISIPEIAIRPDVIVTPGMSKRDIFLLIDGSNNVGNVNFPLVRDFIQRIIENLDIDDGVVRVGVAQYSDNTNVEFYLNSYSKKSEVLNHVERLRLKGGSTLNIGSAMDFTFKNLLINSTGSRKDEGVPQILVVFTAGKSSDSLTNVKQALMEGGIISIGVGAKRADLEELKLIAFHKSLVFKVNEFSALQNIRQQVEGKVQTIAGTEHSVRLRDIVFMIDGTQANGRGFIQICDFVIEVIQELEIDNGNDRVAVVQYSSDPRLEFGLTDHSGKNEVITAIRNLKLKGGTTLNTGVALEYVNKNIFIPSSGSRRDSGASQILILFAGGKSKDDVRLGANELKVAQVVTTAIGARRADVAEIQMIALTPEFAFLLRDFQELSSIQQALITNLRTIIVIEQAADGAAKRDVVFLIDGSEKMRSSFSSVQSFISRVVEKLDVGSDKVRVSVVQYSDDPRPEFLLNSHSSKQDVMDAIRRLRVKGGRQTNTGEALSYITKSVFTINGGSRIQEGVPQFLILLTAGKSTDDVGRAALALKHTGVAPFTIGSRDADDEELRQISLSPDYVFRVDDLRNVGTLEQRLESPLSTLTKDQVVQIQRRILEGAVKRDVVFLVDGSERMRSSFPSVQSFISRVVEKLDVGSDKVRVSVVQYSDDPRPEFLLNSHSNKQDVMDAIRRLRVKGGRQTNTGEALSYVTKSVFTINGGSRIQEGVPQFLILLTAGKSTDDVRRAALALKHTGVVPFTIGSRDADDEELRQISLSPDYVFRVDDLRNVGTLEQRLESPLSTLTRDQVVQIQRRILEGAVKRDVVFLVDGSEEMRSSFPSVQSFISRVVEKLDVGSDKVRVSVVQYSDDPRPEFLLNSHSNKQDVMDAIRRLRVKGGRQTNTGEALSYVTKSVFTINGGSRIQEGVPQFLILLTAGKSTDDVRRAALALKHTGVAPFTIGSRDADDEELRQISLSPDYVFRVDDLRNVGTLEQRLESPLSTLTRDQVVQIQRRILEGAVKRDVVFLVDGSEKMRSSFPSVQSFISRVVEKLDVGSDKVRVSVVQYSDDPRPEFLLNSHSNKQDVMDAIRRLRVKGGRQTNTGEALSYVTKSVFTINGGSRIQEGVPQFLILLTAGKSTDDVRRAALALKHTGVAPFTIGSRDADDEELRQISLSPDYVFRVDDLRNVGTLEQRLESPLSTLTRDQVVQIQRRILEGAVKRDVVFLVDGSEKMRSSFPSVQSFISRVVEKLDVGSDKVRVSVVQYSDDPRPEFLLNSHSNKQDVMDAIRRLRFKGGRQTNTGEALSYVTKSVFTINGGSRIQEGVPQFLILLTAGKSTDDVRRAALALKRTGVAPFTIGSRDADDEELRQISLSPDYVFSVDDLRNVGTLEQRLESPLSTLTRDQIRVIVDQGRIIVDPTPQSVKRDVVFLVDGSDKASRSFSLVKTFIINVAENLDIGTDKVRVSVVQYGDQQKVEFLLNTYSTKPELLAALKNLNHRGGREINTGAALEYVRRNIITRDGGSRIQDGVPQFLILLTSGQSSDDVRQAALGLKLAAVAPFVIGSRDADRKEMQDISLSLDYVFSLETLQDPQAIRQDIVAPLTQLNNAQIIQIRNKLAAEGAIKRDIVFLIDGSDKLRRVFPAIQRFIIKVVDNLDVGMNKVRISVVQYSNEAKVNFLLNTHSTKAEVLGAVRNLAVLGGPNANTGMALAFVRANLFIKPAGSRIEEGVPQFLILFTGGKSTDNVGQAALALKEAGVAPFIIGSRDMDDEELRRISLSPNYIFKVDDLRDVGTLEQRLLKPLLNMKATEISTIHETLRSDNPKKDIVFLVDGSKNVNSGDFAHIRDFIIYLIDSLDIGANKIRIGLAQYSDRPRTEFFLKDHQRKVSLQGAIRRIRPVGDLRLNTGAAVNFVIQNHFISRAGSRKDEGVPQYLILITSSKSQDDIRASSDLIKNSGIYSFAVGAKNPDRDELKNIGTLPYSVYILNSFQLLPTMQEALRNQLLMVNPVDYETPEPPTPEASLRQKKADIVFALDGSMNVGRTNFPVLIEFIRSIVDASYRDDGSFQVGVVQYSSDVSHEFFLNSFTDRESVIKAIQNIQYKGGRMLNTGKALRQIKTQQLIRPAGSRVDEGVPQIVILLTGGKSTDDALLAARELRDSHIKLFTVALPNADVDEMSQIASEQAAAFRVTNYNGLSGLTEDILLTLADSISGELCPRVPDKVKDCNIDILLGLDVSSGGRGDNVFVPLRVLESKVGDVMQRISQLRTLSCSGSKVPVVRVGIMAYSRGGQRKFFDFEDYTPEIMKNFQTLRDDAPYVLDTRTLNAYLQAFRDRSSAGVKVIIHFTDGLDEDINTLRAEAETLRRGGIHSLLLVAMENVAGFEEAALLEFGRGFRYRRPLSISQLDLEYELAEELDNIAERVCCDVPCKCLGQSGDKGPQGPRGLKGNPGPKGFSGHPGYEGGPGERGPPGVNGTQGFQGCQGQGGMKGTRGYPGDKGLDGELGLDGINGEQGIYGIAGPSGERGDLGPRGLKGAKGGRGERGEMGHRGDPGTSGTDNTQRGIKGQKGDSGIAGDPGTDGTPGQRGPLGKNGATGRRGSAGPRGDKGAAGPPGSAGEPGFRGPQGPSGSGGQPGIIGAPGMRGPRGPFGPPGPDGENGRSGPIGRKGEPGTSGKRGESGPVGPRGEMGEDGKDGIGNPGPRGRKGERGPLGLPGPKGYLGENGVKGREGVKGNRGRRGYSGEPGADGQKGEYGYSGPQGEKGRRGLSVMTCDLVKQIRDSCPCCYGEKECPVYPTELAFVIDTSKDSNAAQLNSYKDFILKIVHNLTIVESNCPKGARVAVLTYNSEVMTEIRFSGARNKRDLISRIENMQFTRSSRESSLAHATQFVAKNTFKRVRSGFLMRKLAVFFPSGATSRSPELDAGILKIYDENIISVFLTPKDDNVLNRALQINETGLSQLLNFRNDEATMEKVMSCHVCLDFCEPNNLCDDKLFRQKRSPQPSDVDLDIAFVLDTSESTSPVQFLEIKRFIEYMTEQLEISPQPAASQRHARVAVVQHASYHFQANRSLAPVQVDFTLTGHSSATAITEYIRNKMVLLEGTRALGHAVEWTIANVFEKAPHPRPLRAVVIITIGDLTEAEREKLEVAVTRAKCKGYFFIIFSIEEQINRKNLAYLASFPHDVFFKHISDTSQLHSDAVLRFGRLLPKYLNGENTFYLATELQKQCERLQSDDAGPGTWGTHVKPSDNEISVDPPKLAEPGTDFSVSNVTEDSIFLQWGQAEPQEIHYYEVTVVKSNQNLLILKTNVTKPEIFLKELEDGQMYDVLVTGFYHSKAKTFYNSTFTTKSSANKSSPIILGQEPLENPETVTDICQQPRDEGMCRNFVLRWYYDTKSAECTRFWYGGCNGNQNRFNTQDECAKNCTKGQVPPGMVNTMGT
eukprot:gi/632975158/ref/XP_007904071.1/ PREDICTED: LOW QUALITY PROTEIN: collagen alpha-3(VI) chain [Callorhinchus milii]